MRKEASNVPILAHSHDNYSKHPAKTSKLVVVTGTPRIFRPRLRVKGVKLILLKDSILKQLSEEQPVQAPIVALLISQRNQALVDHKQLDTAKKLSRLSRRLGLKSLKETHNASPSAQANNKGGIVRLRLEHLEHRPSCRLKGVFK